MQVSFKWLWVSLAESKLTSYSNLLDFFFILYLQTLIIINTVHIFQSVMTFKSDQVINRSIVHSSSVKLWSWITNKTVLSCGENLIQSTPIDKFQYIQIWCLFVTHPIKRSGKKNPEAMLALETAAGWDDWNLTWHRYILIPLKAIEFQCQFRDRIKRGDQKQVREGSDDGLRDVRREVDPVLSFPFSVRSAMMTWSTPRPSRHTAEPGEGCEGCVCTVRIWEPKSIMRLTFLMISHPSPSTVHALNFNHRGQKARVNSTNLTQTPPGKFILNFSSIIHCFRLNFPGW